MRYINFVKLSEQPKAKPRKMSTSSSSDQGKSADASSGNQQKLKSPNEHNDLFTPLPTISTSAKFTPKQEEIRMMNVLNGEIERRWSLSESGELPAATIAQDRLSNSQNNPSTTDSYQGRQQSADTKLGHVGTWLDNGRRHSAEMLSNSSVPLITYLSGVNSPAGHNAGGSASALRRKVINSKPKPIAYHRVKDMFEEENHPQRGEIIGERVVTSMMKHEKLLGHSSSTSLSNADRGVPVATADSDTIDKSMLFQSQDDNFMDTGLARDIGSYGSLFAESQRVGRASQSAALPNSKRKCIISNCYLIRPHDVF